MPVLGLVFSLGQSIKDKQKKNSDYLCQHHPAWNYYDLAITRKK